MRKIVVFFVAGIISLQLHSQNIPESAVPAPAKETLKAIFQEVMVGVAKVKWQKENNYFKGSVITDNKPAFAVVDSAGKVQRLETPINVSALTPQAMGYINSQYDEPEVIEVYKILDNKGTETYRVKIASKAMFTKKGEFIKQPKIIKTTPE